MKLSRLTKDIPVLGGNAGPGENVSGISYDSRKVKPGDLFFCISGAEADGHDYAADAAKKRRCVLRMREKAGSRHTVYCRGGRQKSHVCYVRPFLR